MGVKPAEGHAGGKGAEAACGGAGRLSAEGEGSAARRRGICARTR